MEAGLGAAVLCNGPGAPMAVARQALRLLRWAREGGDALPADPVPPARVEGAGAYAGVYRSAEQEIELVAQGTELILDVAGGRSPLERRGEDCFYAPHPALSRFLLRFGRQAGQVVEAWHGPEVLVRRGWTGAAWQDPPAAWRAYVGHYRCHNPWLSNLRVVLRRDRLLLVLPSGEETVLVPLAEGLFRVGEDERLPERLRFDTLVGGQALRTNLAGCDYYRTFTP